jgi:hypothetical protein
VEAFVPFTLVLEESGRKRVLGRYWNRDLAETEFSRMIGRYYTTRGVIPNLVLYHGRKRAWIAGGVTRLKELPQTPLEPSAN